MIKDCLHQNVNFGDWCLMPFSERNNSSYFRIGRIMKIPTTSKSKSDYLYLSTMLDTCEDNEIKYFMLHKQFYNFGKNDKIFKILSEESVPFLIKELFYPFIDNDQLFSSACLNVKYKNGVFTYCQ